MDEPEHFSDDEMAKMSREMSELFGIEKTQDDWRMTCDYLCDLHCCDHPEHKTLPLDDLWEIVKARLNDESDPFPEDGIAG